MNPEQQRLFDEHLWIAYSEARRWSSRGTRFAPEEVRQAALTALWDAVRHYDSKRVACEFGAYATRQVRWGISRYFFHGYAGSPGSAAARHAAERELQGSTPIPTDEDGERTVLDLADDLAGLRELAEEPGEDRYDARLAEIERAIASPVLLTAFERRVLKLRFQQGLKVAAIAAKLRVSEGPIKSALRSGVQKLRSYFSDRGFSTLPVEMPIDA